MDKVIKEIRLKLGLTQEEFAKKVGVSVVTISKYENGVTQPTAQKMALIEGLLNNPNNAVVQFRDVFCFCCFSGLRYSDVAKLQKSDIYDGTIRVVTEKTSDKLTIELNKYTTEILAKYANTNSQLALPIISNVKMNKYLKELGKIAETITARQSNKVQNMEKLVKFLIKPPQGENHNQRNK